MILNRQLDNQANAHCMEKYNKSQIVTQAQIIIILALIIFQYT